MKKLLLSMLVAFSLLAPIRTYAGDFSFGLTTHGTNAWFAIPQIPVYAINTLLGGGTSGYVSDWVSVKDSQGKIKMDNGNFWGIKAKDLFNSFGYGVTFGYQPKFSVVGIFLNGGYKFRQFRMQPDRELDGRAKYKLNTWTAGATLRITPLISNLMDNGWSPILEIGTNYNKVFKCTAPYADDKEQFGSGLSTSFALGVRFESISMSLSYEMSHYDYFNRSFTAEDGSHPYADISSKNHRIAVKIQMEF